MQPGDVVAARFEIEVLAGSGGMGSVWRARDALSGGLVALKAILSPGAAAADRFAREARVLAELSHPAIVRYVAHGATGGGALWLAMEWLEGEDLGKRLARAGLTVAQSVALAGRVADALAAAHVRSIVHRDVKPSNLFLPGGDLERVTVLDFGVARVTGSALDATRSGLFVGTPGYMAPEQARGDGALDARADVFSLGCVLFECLTGRPAFVGDHAMALLARILLEEAPRVRDLRPDVPANVAALCARMLSKSPADRPADGAALAEELHAFGDLGDAGEGEARRMTMRAPSLTSGEQALLSVVVVGRRGGQAEAEAALTRARAAVAPFGGRAEPLADGSIVVVLAGRGAATDQAARAARSALALRTALGDVATALATGRGNASAPLPVGEAIDRAVKLLRGRAPAASSSGGAPAPSGIAIDEVTAGLLDARFDLGGDERGLVLRGEREVVAAVRTLLGKPTPCVGREREIGMLLALLDQCATEGVARRVLVMGAAGVGKSRLRHELGCRIEARPERVLLLVGQGDPVRAGAPLGMLAEALRRECSVLEGEPPVVQRQKIRARVARHVPARERARVAEFLGEMVGAPFPAEGRVELEAARADPMLMADQVRRAWEDWLAAECAAQPVLLVLEDLHWGDLPTTRLVGAALANLADRPLLVVAFARPEVRALFPDLWANIPGEDLRLGELPRRASERLVREVLGEGAAEELVARLVAQAAGNPFYLEELLRAVAEGQGDRLPETVIAMVESRVSALPAEARRALRAASIFGQAFWESGVHALVGADEPPERVRAELAELCKREVVTRRGAGRFASEDEYAFRHGMVREAAYAMLTDADRALGHRLAGAWLERVGEGEAAVVAEHYERGGEPSRAAGFWRRAAEQALGGNDVVAAIARAERGVACGAEGELRGALRLIQAQAYLWRGESAAMEERAREAMDLLPRGSAGWCSAVAEGASAAFRLGHPERTDALGELLLARLAEGDVQSALLTAASRVAFNLYLGGRDAPATALLDRLEAAARARGEVEPMLRAVIQRTRARAALNAGSPAEAVERYEAAAQEFERAGDRRSACQTLASAAYGRIELGAYEDAAAAFRQVMAAAERMGLGYVSALARNNLGNALARLGRLDEALALEREAISSLGAQGDRRLEGNSRLYLAGILSLRGEREEAEREADRAIELLGGLPGMRACGLGVLAEVRLGQGRAGDALAAAREAMEILESLGGIDEGEVRVRLSYAEALHATGELGAARTAIRAARVRVLAKADRIADTGVREGFLRNVAENARVLALAQAWGEGGG